MLGFLGGIIGPVAGSVTYDDGQQIDNEITNLNQVAVNLSHLVGKQTHVIRAQFEEIQGRFNIYEERQKELKPGSRAQTSVVTYELHLHLNLSELSPALLQHKQLMASPGPQQEPSEGAPVEDSQYKNNDKTLSELEDQLNEISSQEQGRAKQAVLTHGSYVGLGLISIGLLTYLGRVKLIAVMTAW